MSELFPASGMPISIPGAERSFAAAQQTPASMPTIDPIIFRDVCADVVLSRGRPERACERRVFAQEVGRRAGEQVLIWNGDMSSEQHFNHNTGKKN